MTWLHVSDFHFQEGDRYQADKCLTALIDAVRQFREKDGRSPDLVFATGDIASHGAEAEYSLASTFFDNLLEAAGLDKRRLFVVPGNHDADRDVGKDLTRTLEKNEDAVTYFDAKREKLHISKKQSEFVKWYNQYFAGIRECAQRTTCSPPQIVVIGGCKIAILLVNSALFCSGYEKDPDQNKLWIGRRCLDTAVAELKASGAMLNSPLTKSAGSDSMGCSGTWGLPGWRWVGRGIGQVIWW
ncbi:MAG: metallophosphoesterase [Rhodospirillales bacterium]|nr:metallophosphoesterase [Rhodospirillales bacterium]